MSLTTWADTCSLCDGTRFWPSKSGYFVCYTCHPDPLAALVILAQLQRWQAEIQPDYLIIRFRQPGGPTHQKTLEAIRAFGEQVIPKL